MGGKTRKLQAAKTATATAIDCLRDGVQFGIVAGHQYASRVYPLGDDLAEANDDTREAAKRAVARLDAGGGTAIGQWLLEAERWLPEDERVIRHAILLTDGYNQHEKPKQTPCGARPVRRPLPMRLPRCRHRLGRRRAAHDREPPAGNCRHHPRAGRHGSRLPLDDGAIHGQGHKRCHAANLDPGGARVELVSQVLPEIADISSRREETSDRIGDYPTGAWANESRDYHIRISFPAARSATRCSRRA